MSKSIKKRLRDDTDKSRKLALVANFSIVNWSDVSIESLEAMNNILIED